MSPGCRRTRSAEEVRSIPSCFFDLARKPPRADMRVVTGEKYRGNVPVVKTARPGVLRVLHETVYKTFLLERFMADDTANTAAHRIDEHERGDLSLGENVVPDANFVVDILVYDTLVNSLVSAADEHEGTFLCE